jgi:hypothetical protein
MNTDNGFSLSMSWKPLIYSLKECTKALLKEKTGHSFPLSVAMKRVLSSLTSMILKRTLHVTLSSVLYKRVTVSKHCELANVNLGPALEPGYVIPCVGKLMEEKSCFLNEVSPVMILGTIIYKLTTFMICLT